MRPQRPFELPANPFQRRAGPLIARIRVKAHSQHLPCFESIRQHEQLCLRVCCGADRRASQPRIANLTSVRKLSPMPRMSRWPRPSLDIPEARRSNDRTVARPHNRKRQGAASIPPGQSDVDISDSLRLALWNRTPLIQPRVSRCSDDQPVGVSARQRFQTNPPP